MCVKPSDVSVRERSCPMVVMIATLVVLQFSVLGAGYYVTCRL